MSVSFRFYTPQDWPGVLRMYLTFEPKAAYQGLPPFKEVTTRRWLADLMGHPANTNFVLGLDHEVLAHAALVHYPQLPAEEEIIIFVHQDHQHQGWGRKLFLAAMNWACLHRKLQRVWLTVGWYNAAARRLYSSIGFVPIPETMEDGELEMVRPLRCATCLETHCPIHESELIHAYLSS